VGDCNFLARRSEEETGEHNIVLARGGEVSEGRYRSKGEGETNLKYGVENLMVVINSGAVVKSGAASTWSMPSNKR
jgi:hypothetical protein